MAKTVTAGLSIDPCTGVVGLDAFRIGRRSTTGELRKIDPGHFKKQAADAGNFFCRFAELDAGAYRIACQSSHRDGSVLYFTFTPFVPAETRDDVDEESEKKKTGVPVQYPPRMRRHRSSRLQLGPRRGALRWPIRHHVVMRGLLSTAKVTLRDSDVLARGHRSFHRAERRHGPLPVVPSADISPSR